MPFHPVAETLTRTALSKMCEEYATILHSPGSGLWLVPNASARSTILDELLKHSTGVFAPNIQTFEEFAERIAGGEVRPLTATRWALHDTIAELQQKKSFPYHSAIVERRGFFASCHGYFEELAVAGISLSRAEQALRASRGAKREDIARLTRAMGDKSTQATQGWWYELFAKAAERLANGLPPGFKRIRKIFVSGFRYFQPRERLLLDVSANHVEEIRVALFADPARTRPETFAECKTIWQSLLETPPKTAGKAGKAPTLNRPAGIAHLAANLFHNDSGSSQDATGVSLIKAPGLLGECRLIARKIRRLLNDGVAPGKIVVTTGAPADMLDVFADVCGEYRIPVYHETERTLQANPAVRTLLRAARLAQTDWPFEEVTALLRSNYFHPAWPVAAGDMARHSEGLLRQLGEPRSREAYLRAADIWANAPPEALEDEQAESHRRDRKGKLAKRCLPFLTKFFDLWKKLPTAAPASGFTEWMRNFADEIGLTAVAAERPADRRALESLWKLLDDWNAGSLLPDAFWRGIDLLTGETTIPPGGQATGRVRFLATESAAETACEYLFLAGLGEKSPLSTSSPDSILDEADRIALRHHGTNLNIKEAERPREELLFLQLVARPTKELILSYPAVDGGGQDLLPGIYLRSVLELFTDDAIPTTHQRMLIEGFLTQEVLSDAEYRVQLADRMREAPDNVVFPSGGLNPELADHLKITKRLAEARFLDKSHNEFSGMFRSEASLKRVAEKFGAEKIFSPTALETYVACPFRFWLEQLLGLEELEEPSEEIEHTRRGSVYHRALARLHERLRKADPQMTFQKVPESVTADLAKEMNKAIKEYVDRSPSEVSRMLWRLEGERLQRSVLNYRNDWNKFLDDWHKAKIAPVPELFEVDFGFGSTGATKPPLTIKLGDVEARFGGRIDRVDIAELPNNEIGFWIIDYKTGRKTSYVASQLETLEKLQLPLYALAVQEVFYPELPSRPLGLAYWLVTDDGAKKMLPKDKQSTVWLMQPAGWNDYRSRLEAWVIKLVTHIRNAEFPLAPRSEQCTSICPFSQVCRITQSRHIEKDWRLELPMLGEPKEETGLVAESN